MCYRKDSAREPYIVEVTNDEAAKPVSNTAVILLKGNTKENSKILHLSSDLIAPYLENVSSLI